jgi:hypothetical protein
VVLFHEHSILYIKSKKVLDPTRQQVVEVAFIIKPVKVITPEQVLDLIANCILAIPTVALDRLASEERRQARQNHLKQQIYVAHVPKPITKYYCRDARGRNEKESIGYESLSVFAGCGKHVF